MQQRLTIGLGALLAALVALGPISTDMYLPALPALAREFGSTPARVQLTMSLFLAGFACAQLVYGPLSDRFGRRPVLIGGLVIYAFASAACALVESVDQLIVARFFQAIGACTGPVLARAVVRDIFGRERAARMLAYIGMAMGMIPALAPILGGYVTLWFGWRANFVFLVGFGILLLLGILFVLSETNRHRYPEATRPSRLVANYKLLLGNRAYAGYVCAAGAAYAGLFAFLQGSPFVFIDFLGVAPESFGFYFALNVAGYIVGSVFVARYSARVGLDPTILLGGAIMALSGLAMAAFAWAGIYGTMPVIVPQVFYMMGLGLVMPNAMAGAIAPFPTMAGAASALLGFAQMGGAALVGIMVGTFHDESPTTMATAILVMGSASVLGYLLLAWPVRERAAAVPEPRS